VATTGRAQGATSKRLRSKACTSCASPARRRCRCRPTDRRCRCRVRYCRVDGCGTVAAAVGDEVDAYSKAAIPRGPAHISTRSDRVRLRALKVRLRGLPLAAACVTRLHAAAEKVAHMAGCGGGLRAPSGDVHADWLMVCAPLYAVAHLAGEFGCAARCGIAHSTLCSSWTASC
jgi:hypothetical protein